MKLLQILSLLVLSSLFFSGCASQETAVMDEPEEASMTGNEASSAKSGDVRTAYDGATGSGLLMERYKSGNIHGYAN